MDGWISTYGTSKLNLGSSRWAGFDLRYRTSCLLYDLMFVYVHTTAEMEAAMVDGVKRIFSITFCPIVYIQLMTNMWLLRWMRKIGRAHV